MTPEQRENTLRLIETTPLVPVDRADGWVYFVVCLDDTVRCKIGFTKGSVEKRIASLQTGCPSDLALLVMQPGNLDTERALHERFASSRIRGEWFEMTDELRAYVVRVVWAMSEIYLSKGRRLQPWMEATLSASFQALDTMPDSLADLLEANPA